MTPPRTLAAGLAFTSCAGFVDAVGFLELGGYFTSFMSGNTTQFGVGIAHPQDGAPALPAALLVMFFAGALLGSLIALAAARWGRAGLVALILVAIGIALALNAAGFAPIYAMLPLAAGAGMQNAVLRPLGAARLGTTFVTGTLFAAAQDLARALRREAPLWRWTQHLAIWGALCGGAVLGAFADLRWGIPALLAPAAIYACFFAGFARAAIRQPA